MSDNVFKFLDSINYSKEDIMDDFNEKEYLPYLINHFLSGTIDTLIFSQQMNMNYHIDKRLQYDYLRLSIRKKKRFSKWLKPDQSKDLDSLCLYYGVSKKRAKELLDFHNEDMLKIIKKKTNFGGINKTKNNK